MTENGEKIDVRVEVTLLEADAAAARLTLALYAYSAGGKLIDQRRLGENCSGSLMLPVGEAAAAVRLLVGPEMAEPDLEELLRRGAQERRVYVRRGDAGQAVRVEIRAAIWRPWAQGGGGGGEIDPLVLVLLRLPDWVQERVREVVKERFPTPPAMDVEAPASTELRLLGRSGRRLELEWALLDHAPLIRSILCFIYPREHAVLGRPGVTTARAGPPRSAARPCRRA